MPGSVAISALKPEDEGASGTLSEADSLNRPGTLSGSRYPMKTVLRGTPRGNDEPGHDARTNCRIDPKKATPPGPRHPDVGGGDRRADCFSARR